MNKTVLAIARREAGLYLLSISLWLGMAATFAAVLGMHRGLAGPLEHFLGGEGLGILLTAFIAILIIGAGLAREARDSFDDVWNSLPTRNSEQFFGKVLGAGVVVAVLGFALLLIIPVGWLMVGSVWTSATTSAVVAFVIQIMTVLLLSVSIATFLCSVIPHLRVRYFVGLAIVISLSIAQALGIDNDALWAVLLSPFIFAGIPYSHSSLFGMYPWFPAVAWHSAFQVLISFALIVLGSLLYERRRDPAERRIGRTLLLGVLLIGVAVSGIQYQSYWNDVDKVFQAHLETDTVFRMVELDSGERVRADTIQPMMVTAYDIGVHWLPGPDLRVTAVLHVQGDPTVQPWPLTLHHQWEVANVTGQGIAGWRRDSNFIWLEVEPDTEATQITVQYAGRPFLWHKPMGTISPMHFLSDQGGYLSPLLAWYPLPGERTLATRVGRGSRDTMRRYWTQLPFNGPPPLLEAPVPINLTWHGPDDLPVVSNLDGGDEIVGGEHREIAFAGMSDGISLLIGHLAREQSSDMTILGAASVVQSSPALGEAYDRLLEFYDELVGRSIPREPVVAVPTWLRSFYVTHRMVGISGLQGTSGIPRIETFTLLGTKPVITEQNLVTARGHAVRWSSTGDARALLAATEKIQLGILQAVWGRPHDHLTFANEPIALALAEYSMLRWAEEVLGSEASETLRGTVRPPDPDRRILGDDTANAVLTGLMELEEHAGPEAVTIVLGHIYDHLETHTLSFDEFESIVAQAKAGVL